jgi:hypothetical protein
MTSSTQEHVVRHDPARGYQLHFESRVLCTANAAYRNGAPDVRLPSAYPLLFSDLEQKDKDEKVTPQKPFLWRNSASGEKDHSIADEYYQELPEIIF